MDLVEALQVATTLAMTGIIWLVQVVQYPAFHEVDAESFVAYHRHHSRRITYVVGPLMLVELASAAYLLWAGPAFGRSVQALLLVLVLAVWASTAFLQVPLHEELGKGKDDDVIRRLVAGNWIRTVLWTGKSLLLGFAYLLF